MRYCSIDIETTGLDPKTCDIVQFAAVIDDLSNPQPLEKLPKFQTHFSQKTYTGEPYALAMHPNIFKKIADAQRKRIEENEFGDRFMNILDLPSAFKVFLTQNGFEEDPKSGRVRITVAGKNIAMFDLPFLNKKLKKNRWGDITILHRVIDPAILYYKPGDEKLPDSATCLERAGMAGEVAHTALEDALMVIKLIRHKLLPNFGVSNEGSETYSRGQT